MDLKYLLGIICLFASGICFSEENIDKELIGAYSAEAGGSFELIFDYEPNSLAISTEHITQGASAEHNNQTFCYLTGDFDIIIPRTLTFGKHVECLGGSAEITGRDTRFEEIFSLVEPVYIVRVTRKKSVEIDGRSYKRARGADNLNLYYSEKLGLLAIEYDRQGKNKIFVKSIPEPQSNN